MTPQAPTRSAPNCSEPPLPLGALARRDPSGGPVGALAAEAAARGAAFHPAFMTRTAIRAAADLLALQGGEVLMPAWNCGSEIDPLLAAGARVRLYRVGADGRADTDDLAARIGPGTRALYVIRYFGWPDPESDARIRALADARGLPVIEDCALDFHGATGTAEVTVHCFYKFFPVPGGGALTLAPTLSPSTPGAGDVLLTRPPPRSFAPKALVRAGLRAALGRQGLDRLKALTGLGRGSAPAGEPPRLPSGDPAMPGHYRFDPAFRDAGLPRLTARLLAGLDPADAARRRIANEAGLRARLAGCPAVRPLFGPLPDSLPETAVPLALPVLVRDRDRLSAALEAEGIAANPWWAGYHPDLDWTDFPEARFLKDHVLALPVHQGLGPAHLDRIAARLAALAEGPAPESAPEPAPEPEAP